MNKYNNEILPQLILFRKEELHYTQNELAEVLNCTRANISKFEKGKSLSGKILAYYITHGLPEFMHRLEQWKKATE